MNGYSYGSHLDITGMPGGTVYPPQNDSGRGLLTSCGRRAEAHATLGRASDNYELTRRPVSMDDAIKRYAFSNRSQSSEPERRNRLVPESPWRTVVSKPHLGLIALIGVIVPRRLRVDWREEWESELRYRERLLSDWDRLDWRHKWDLLRRSSSAFWDALWLQRQRREDEMVQDLDRRPDVVEDAGVHMIAILTLASALAPTPPFSAGQRIVVAAPRRCCRT